VVIDTGESLLTFCAGADEMELAEMIGQANEMAQAMVLRNAPPKEMFN
jgi:enoyl-CoA hydratase/carnithine racemase